VRAVLDPNVVISGLLSPSGAPAEVLRSFDRGEFELVVSRLVVDELTRALAYPKLRRHVAPEEAENAVRWLRDSATIVDDPAAPLAVRSADPGDDYLIALAAAERTALVSGDKHLLSLSAEIPVFTPREFIGLLGAR
jgi:putative PIN family toxin of toxin-antitoxin system